MRVEQVDEKWAWDETQNLCSSGLTDLMTFACRSRKRNSLASGSQIMQIFSFIYDMIRRV